MAISQIIDWCDIRFTVVASASDYHVDYMVYEIEGFENGSNKVLWHKRGADTSPDPVESLDLAEVFLHGFVKWDGCSNWHFDTLDDGVMIHGCSREDLTRLGEVLARCWDLTAELCPHWNP